MERDYSHRIFTIPNFLSLLRVFLAAVFGVIYWNAQSRQDYGLAIGVLALSGLTDFADGKIARHFHMISELGKVLDPIADKLTQAVVACCLARHYAPMKLLFLVLVVKELTQGIYGAYAVKKAGRNDGAMWCGKITTCYLYALMILLILLPELPQAVSTCGILIGVGLLIWSMVSYLVVFRRMVGQNG
jgi:cardiolipin synthase